MATELTWLGHAAFRVDTPGGKRIYVDPFLTGNPRCPASEGGTWPENVEVKECERVKETLSEHFDAADANADG